MKEMNARKVSYLILFLFAITSCKMNSVSEERILSDIFPQLVDSLDIKWRQILPPPPPPLFDKDSNFVGVDSTRMELILSEYQKYLDRVDSIDPRILIGVTDSCFFMDWNDLKSRTYCEDSIVSRLISLNELEKNNSRVLNLNQISIPDSIRLITKSEIEKKYTNIWTSLRDLKFAGLLEISRIYLSENNDFGLLQVDYYYDSLDGYGYFIIIEKIGEKWQVKRLLQNWVS